MLIPSVDILGGHAVQLIGGKLPPVYDWGDPIKVAERFSVAGTMAVIDLDAAMRTGGDNSRIIRQIARRYDCNVGGGIRSVEVANKYLDAGARRVILGTAAKPEILRQLPKDRVMAALDARHGKITEDGWQVQTDITVEDRIKELLPFVGGFLFTLVESEGRMQGTQLERAKHLVELAKPADVIIAGGITTVEEIAALDRMGADAQVGMALYSGALTLAQGFMAPLVTDRPDGLFATVVCDELGVALGLAYSSRESLTQAIETQQGVYQSRKRGLWVKGATSGDTQRLLRVDADCDRDALRFLVEQNGGFCHNGTWTCWGADHWLGSLERFLRTRLETADQGSYTRKLFEDPGLLRAKLLEEAGELGEAMAEKGRADVNWEAADLLYFTVAAMVRSGVSLKEVLHELARRHGARRNQRQGADE